MADRRIDNRFMGWRGRYKRKTGTCNVCSAPCSSCMHRNVSESSDENSHGGVESQCSYDEDDNNASEASNRVSSNHDTSFENVGSKEMKVDSGKSKSSHSLVSDHQARNTPGQEKVKEKSGAENSKDKESKIIGSFLDRFLNKSEEPSSESFLDRLLYKAEGSSSIATSESETGDSEMLELDVKVCDICGDAGREDLLAICSRCSDGAEHTYCMRVMLKKVPEGGWLCEECKFAEIAEKQKLETKWKRVTEVNLNTQSSSKRLIEKHEAAPDAKRQAVESPTGSPKRSALPRLSALSRETSFKGLEKTTRKLAHHSSFNSHSSDDTENSRSTDSQLQSLKGSFLKSNSFSSSSSRPKVKPVDDFMLPPQKTGKESASLDANGSKQLKDRSAEANPSVSTVQHKLISRSNSSISNANRACDLKGFQSDGKQGSLKKQSRHLNRNRPEDRVASEQLSSEAKRTDEQTNVDGLSRSRECREVREKSKGAVGNRQRSDLLSQKGQNAEPTDTSCASESKLSTTSNTREDINKGNRLRAAVDAALRKKPSFGKNRGLEQSDLPSVSNVDPSCDKAFQNLPAKLPVVRDWPEFKVDSSCDKAFQNLLSKVPVVRDWPVSNVNSNCESLPSKVPVVRDWPVSNENSSCESLPSKVPVVRDWPVSNVNSSCESLPSKVPVVRDWPVGLQGGQSNLRTDKHTTAVNGNQSTIAGADAMPSSQSIEPEVHFSSVKPVKRDIPVVVPTVLPTKSAIPEPEYIWQGDLEVWKRGNLSAMHSGMHAYRSTLASPKVVEVVNQFPVKMTMNEVPRLSIWPAQFQDVGAKEEHVALFFFAKDVESYEKNYKPLVDNMIQNDLALKGNLEGIELLIFASNQLPKNCQRWNMLFFLWGVFRGRRKNCSKLLKNTPLPASCVVPNMGKTFSTRESFCHEDNMSGAADKVKAFSVEAVDEAEEGEIGASPRLKNEKTSGHRTVNLDDQGLCDGPVNKKLKTGTRVETECSIAKRDGFASRKSGASERIVFPLDLNDENPSSLSL